MQADKEASASLPSTMKAVVYRKYGDPKDVLEIVPDYPIPRITKRTQMLVKVHAAAINPVDWKMVVGYLSFVTSRLPFVPGFDLSGVVVETGPGVTEYKVGDEVFAMNDFSMCGSFAEYVVIDKKFVAPKPTNLTHIEAASIPLVGLTSYQGLVDSGKIASGMKVLIVGGSSGTGSFAVQYAKHVGAEVTAVCSGKNEEFVQELGATRVIDYTQEDWGEVLKGQNYDIVYDCVGGVECWEKAQHVLKKNGRFATIAGDKQEAISVGKVFSVAGSIINRNFWAFVSDAPYYGFVMCQADGKQLTTISKLLAEGVIKPFVSRVFSFDEVKEMFAESQTGRARGKLVLAVVSDEGSSEKKEEEGAKEEEVQEEGKGKEKEPEEKAEEAKDSAEEGSAQEQEAVHEEEKVAEVVEEKKEEETTPEEH